MKVLHINTMDEGGAAIACIRIHLGLLAHGIDSKILFLKKKKDIPESYRFQTENKLFYIKVISRFKSFFKKSELSNGLKKNPNIEMFTFPNTDYDITKHQLYINADIIQLNWVSGFLDETSFFKKNFKPVVWRMPDLYTCGGGNHYELGFPFQKLRDLIEKNTKIRKKSLENKKITFVPISNWVLQKANESSLIAKFPKKVIHNGVDFSIFKPFPQKFSRLALNLPQEKPIILIGADKLDVLRKGLKIVLEALNQIDILNYNIVFFGKKISKLPDKYFYVGPITDERMLPLLYSASDYFVMPSIEEAFGQVTIEALACGIPVISFPNGGSLDIIDENLNGVLAKDFTSEALAIAIKKAFLTNFNKDAIIKDVKLRFNIIDKVKKYIQLYNSLING